MKMNTAAVLALCAVAISAMPSTVVPEEVEHLPHAFTGIDDASPAAKKGAEHAHKEPDAEVNDKLDGGAPVSENLITEDTLPVHPVAAKKVLPHYVFATVAKPLKPPVLLRAKPSPIAPRLEAFKPLPTLSHMASVTQSLRAIKPLPASDPKAAIHRTATQQLVKLHSTLSAGGSTGRDAACSAILEALVKSLKLLFKSEIQMTKTLFGTMGEDINNFLDCDKTFDHMFDRLLGAEKMTCNQVTTNAKGKIEIDETPLSFDFTTKAEDRRSVDERRATLFQAMRDLNGDEKSIRECQRDKLEKLFQAAWQALDKTNRWSSGQNSQGKKSNAEDDLAKQVCKVAAAHHQGFPAKPLKDIHAACTKYPSNSFNAVLSYLKVQTAGKSAWQQLLNDKKVPSNWLTNEFELETKLSSLEDFVCKMENIGLTPGSSKIKFPTCTAMVDALKTLEGSKWWESEKWKLPQYAQKCVNKWRNPTSKKLFMDEKPQRPIIEEQWVYFDPFCNAAFYTGRRARGEFKKGNPTIGFRWGSTTTPLTSDKTRENPSTVLQKSKCLKEPEPKRRNGDWKVQRSLTLTCEDVEKRGYCKDGVVQPVFKPYLAWGIGHGTPDKVCCVCGGGFNTETKKYNKQ